MRALLPAALLAFFGGWCGTFYYGASAAAVVLGHLVLLAVVAWGWRGWDPLRLGARGKVLPPLLWLWLLLSLRGSPVPRAGWVAAALLPAFLAVPAVVARCWDESSARRRGGLALCAVAGGAALIALAGMAWQGSPRAAQPLGNAVLLGAFLAILAPLGLVVAAAERRRRWRAAAIAAVALVGVAVLATRSVAAIAAAVVGTALVLPPGRRRWLVVPLLGGVLVLGTRLPGLASGLDPSLQARWTYWQAGVRGIFARPAFGWGPGSTSWTVAPLLRPRPGINPPGEVVGDLHAVPLQLAYELGLPGLAVAMAAGVAFVLARLRERPGTAEPSPATGTAEGPDLRRGGLAGLAAGGTALLAGPTLGTTALWVTLAVAAGAALAGSARCERRPLTSARSPSGPLSPRRGERGVGESGVADQPRGGGREGGGSGLRPRGGAWLSGAIALLLLAPLDAALACYEAARHAPPPRAVALLELAAELDPGMPLYRARIGWLARTAAGRALALGRAAAAAPAVPALQLAAGWSAQAAGQDGEEALARACDGDPLSGPAPWLLAMAAPKAERAPRLAARALLADPPLLAALSWEREPELLAAALAEVTSWQGVDEGLRQALLDRAKSLPWRGRLGALRVTMDEEPSTAVSLHVFRRRPWPATLAIVPVRRDLVGDLERLPAAGSLSTTQADAFPVPCVSGQAAAR